MVIQEYKTINDDVCELGDFIGQLIIKDVHQQTQNVSKQTFRKFVENTIQVKLSNFLKEGDILTVNYIMYFCSSEFDYNLVINGLGEEANSEADNETNTIRIVSGFIGNKVSKDFYETIYHELEHLSQYGLGMQKRVSLYDKMGELLRNCENNLDGYYVGLCCYYCFKHEQDAFVHQFYKQLHNNKQRDKFDKIVKWFGPYQTFLKAYKILIENKNNPQFQKAINYLGFSKRSFFKLMDYRSKRFYTKLKNAYKRYMEETLTLTESNIERYIKRMEKVLTEHSSTVNWSLETIFCFG